MPAACRTALAAAVLSAGAAAQVVVSPSAVVTSWDYAAVRPVLRELREAAEQVHQVARQRLQTRDPVQQAALNHLATLARHADLLLEQVDHYRLDPARSRDMYRTVVVAYTRAAPLVVHPQFGTTVLDDFARLGTLLARLSAVYEPNWRYEQVRTHAARLQEASDRALQSARARQSPARATDRHAVFLLERLASSAAHFRSQLEFDRNPVMTDQDLRVLQDDYARAVPTAQLSSFVDAVRPELEAMADAASALTASYEVPWRWEEARMLADLARSTARRLRQGAVEPGGTQAERLRDELDQVLRAAEELVLRLDQGRGAPDSHPEVEVLEATWLQAAPGLARARMSGPQAEEYLQLGGLIDQLKRLYAGKGYFAPPAPSLQGVPVGTAPGP